MMLLDFMEQVNGKWNELQFWFNSHYDDPLLWGGIVLGIVLFMVVCSSYLGKTKR